MADNWIMGHTKWLFVLVICLSSRNAFCDLHLNMEESVTGVHRYSVKIPCTYTPSKGYEEVKVEWSLPSEEIVQRLDSQDHIPLLKFRDRVEISNSPGDVSLTIRRLSIGDKGNMKCKVIWKKNDGTLTFSEEITVLKVLRVKPATENPKENIITSTHVETTIPVTEKHDDATSERTTENSHLDDGFHDGTVSTMESTEQTAIKGRHESTTGATFYTREILYTNAAIHQKEGFRMPLLILIAIIICVLCITAVVIVLLIVKHRKRKGYIYQLSTMNQLLAVEDAGQRCQSNTDETRACNTYEQSNPPPVSEYEGILGTFSNEYESLVVEKSPENKCS